ncbi:pyocin knob domain-containing protein [Chryseobacterium sp. YIM B08800]|uniref:pyocin knob domain-containing protein n=1 Tax=Chryseobacterium sp. YIM B08800 TaxID=2984136 RepID=UPI0022402F3A|nr:pyocin knob domain-containing protein [Chryseobacterium sp. YIM B08800]
MDTKYAYYSTSKGYRVVGGTAAHFLKADGSLDNSSYLTTDTIQNITAVKSFITSGGSGWANNALRVTSNDGSNPGLTFYKTGVDVGVVNYDGLNDFRFRNSNDTASKFIFAQGFKKDGSDDNSFLTAGGGSVLRSTYPTTTQADAKYFPKTNVVTITTDLNTLILEGVYYGNLWVNNPVGYNTISTVTIKRYSQDWIAQEFRPITNASKIFIRNRYNGTTWTDWKEIITSDTVTSFVPYAGATSDLTLADKNLNLTTGSLSKFENGLRVFNKVFHKTYSNVAQIGIISFKFPQATTSATMFTVDINYHEYNSRSLGKLRVAFYKQTAAILHTSGRAALWEATDNLPSTIINIGIDLAGNVCINLGEITTNWGTYAHFEIERVQTSYSGVNADWSKGWSQTTETVAPVVLDTYQSLVNIVPEIVATRTFMDTNLMGSIPKSSSSLGTLDLNTVLTAGFYQQLSTSNATIANNYPTTVIGYLNVYRVSTNRVVQEYTEFTNLTTYKRSYNGSTWSTWIESGITTTTNQIGLYGNKTTSGAWNFSGVNANPITLQRLGNTSNNSIAFGFDTPSMYAGMADAGNFAIGNNANLLSTPNRKFWIDFATNSVNAPGQIGGSTLTSKDLGGFTINTATNASKAEMILRHVWTANNQTFGIGGTGSATAGSMSEWGMYKWLNNRTVNGKDGFFGWTGDNDELKATSLAGTGVRMVTANSVGTLSTQAIPSSQILINNATNAGGVDISGGNTVYLRNLLPSTRQDANVRVLRNELSSYVTNAGSVNYPSTFGIGIRNERYSSATDQRGFDIFSGGNSGQIYFKTFSGSTTDSNWEMFASREWSDGKFSLLNHSHTFDSITDKPTTLDGYSITDAIPLNQKGSANGVATLDGSGLIPSTQLPSYVDDVIEGASLAAINALPANEKQTGKIYVTTDTNKSYRWSGNVFIEISSGAVQSVNGQTGVVNLTYSDVGASSVNHTHAIAQVTGLQNALDGKVDDSQVLTNVPAGALFTDTIYTLPTATSTVKGGVEIFSDAVQTVASNAVTATVNRTYGIQLNSAGQAVVNVPWSDTNNTYANGTGLSLTGATFSVNYGTTAGTSAQGNDSRIINGQTAFDWGNHAGAGYAKLTSNQTFTNTNTFSKSPIIPNGTLDAHAVNVNQLNTKANGQENATAVGFSSGNIPTTDGGSYPYMYHNSGLYVALATQSYVQTNFLSTPNGTSIVISGSNLNNYLKTGFYRGVGLINAPFNNNGWWYVTIETHDATWVTQKATSFGSGNIPNVTYQRTMNGGNWSDWAQIWTTQDFTVANIQQWNYAYQYGLKVNETFSVNMSSGMAITDDGIDSESGLTDLNEKNLVSAKRGSYYKYGSSIQGFEGLNYEYKKQKFGLGREANDIDKLTVEGSVKAIKNFKSEGEKPDTLFIPNGELASLKDEIVNDQSDYAIRLNPHEYEIDSSGSIGIDDRNRLIHVIGEQIKMTVDFKKVYPKQQIVIYNFDQNGGTMVVKIQGKTIANVNARGFLRLYVTKSLKVIAERQQPCEFVWG